MISVATCCHVLQCDGCMYDACTDTHMFSAVRFNLVKRIQGNGHPWRGQSQEFRKVSHPGQIRLNQMVVQDVEIPTPSLWVSEQVHSHECVLACEYWCTSCIMVGFVRLSTGSALCLRKLRRCLFYWVWHSTALWWQVYVYTYMLPWLSVCTACFS